MADEEDAFGVGHAQVAADDVAREDVAVAIDFRADAPGFAVAAQAAAANLQRAQAFLQAFLERAADGQWLMGGSPIGGATNNSLLLTNVQLIDAGNYTVTVTNAFGAANSVAATLTVNLPPVITSQPASQVVTQNQSASFTVTVTGDLPLTYQWRRNGFTIQGATNVGLILGDIQPTQAGNYSAVASNDFGRATSKLALLTVHPLPPAPEVRLGTPVRSLNSFAFIITGASASTWWVLRSVSVTGPWAGVGTVSLGANGVGVFTDTNPPPSRAFYRVASALPNPPVITVQSPMLTAGTAIFRIFGSAGMTADVERAVSLTGPWTNIGSTLIGTNGIELFQDTNPPAGSGFYRAVRP